MAIEDFIKHFGYIDLPDCVKCQTDPSDISYDDMNHVNHEEWQEFFDKVKEYLNGY